MMRCDSLYKPPVYSREAWLEHSALVMYNMTHRQKYTCILKNNADALSNYASKPQKNIRIQWHSIYHTIQQRTCSFRSSSYRGIVLVGVVRTLLAGAVRVLLAVILRSGRLGFRCAPRRPRSVEELRPNACAMLRRLLTEIFLH